MFVDSHCHLQLIDYSELKLSEEEVINKAKENNVEHMLCVSTYMQQFQGLEAIANKYANVSISVGVHPCEDPKDFSYDNLLKLTESKNVVAIGETGLDYYRKNDLEYKKQQQEKFVQHIEVAKTSENPLIIHTRAAKEDTIKFLKDHNAGEIGGVIHCFTEDLDMAKRCIDLGFHISFSGIVSFKNATDLQEVAKSIPLEKMLIETDCPYLAPVPMRGKINQPAYVKHVAEAIAKLRNIPVEEVGKTTTSNYYKLFSKSKAIN